MIYLDTSSLLKLLHNEPESGAVQAAIALETDVVLSTLSHLEALVQLKAAWLGGEFRQPHYLKLSDRLTALCKLAPFRLSNPGSLLFDTAIRQDAEAGSLHLRTVDRLHLAAMEEIGANRLMTHDRQQALAARQLGFAAISPGWR
ncbi:type II toxin-antitoxin system VapC family toxin [soil metagenome]